MIRGALILGAGLAIGYAKGLSENERIVEKLADTVEDMSKRFNAWADEQEKAKTLETPEGDPSQ